MFPVTALATACSGGPWTKQGGEETVMEEMVTDIFENESVFPKLLHMSISIDPDAQQAI